VGKLTFELGETIPSGAEEVTASKRLSSRISLMIRAAKLIADNREYLCLVRNVSVGGLNVQIFHDLPKHESLAVEFDNGETRAVNLRWQSGDRLGCEFLFPLEDPAIVVEQSGLQYRRRPRLQVTHDAELHAGGRCIPVVLRDISQQGAGIDSDTLLMLGELVRIKSEVLPSLFARVRWRSHPRYGLVLEKVFSMAELAKLCRDL